MRNCLVCGKELDPEWTQCAECQTPIPSATAPVMLEIPQAQGTGDTSRAALWAAALVVFGFFCVPFGPLAAVPVGMSAMREIDESGGHMGGRVLARTGIIGGAIFGSLQVIFLLAAMVPLLFGGPNLLVGMTGGGEDMGLGALKQVYRAQSMARFSVAVDGDGDGLGEFVEFAKLGEGKLPYLRSDVADGAVGGYWLLAVLPDGPDAREQNWWGIAQPQFPDKGWRTFVVDATGVIWARDTGGQEPDLSTLHTWDAVDMVVTQYDADVQAAQAEIARMQMEQSRQQAQVEAAYDYQTSYGYEDDPSGERPRYHDAEPY